ncbi:MAG: cyclic di-GMP phosphodiesterase [Burkholderiaceae bacterium]
MLKSISVLQLRQGMYLESLQCSWLSNPFWKRSRLLSTAGEIDLVQKSGIQFATINIAKGIDVGAPNTAEAPACIAEPEHTEPAPAALQKPGLQKPAQLCIEHELEAATHAIARSKVAVESMFNDARLGKAVDFSVSALVIEDIATSIGRNASALISLVRLKDQDDYTYMHSVAVCALMIALATEMGFSEEEIFDAGTAGLLHDIGKMSVSTAILNKPAKLSDEEFRAVKQHPQAGYDLLQNADGMSRMAMDVCLHHHEKMDGSGYPKGLSGDQISIHARMGAICDVYDAVTSDRPYKEGWAPADSIKKMASWTASHFDKAVFQAFVKVVGIYPVGTLVRLQSGRLGVVIEHSKSSLLTPRVKLFFSTKSNLRIAPVVVDLALPGERDTIVTNEDPAVWKFTDLEAYWTQEACRRSIAPNPGQADGLAPSTVHRPRLPAISTCSALALTDSGSRWPGSLGRPADGAILRTRHSAVAPRPVPQRPAARTLTGPPTMG